ncbi:S-layer homology domain-containing protein [Candidatus Villigracilis affinis]|uniref:S-layer homology domain-containing protein n=1 Tax=Candidatus Villigracilis affinis TaxID=3140682 RepID=UPI002A214198|nr:S-layer homology domain-containing protein [Anaerolineales bacterium]
MNNLWNHFVIKPILNAAFTDVAVGAYYAEPVIQAYGWGVADATSDTTFSPDQPVTRGEFAKMLYRALSRVG